MSSHTTHIVQQGEYLSKIASDYGFVSYKPIWELSENAVLRQERDNNPNVLYPGDELAIPLRNQKWDPGDTEQRHRFRTTDEPLQLNLEICNYDMSPIDNKKCVLGIEMDTNEVITDDAARLETLIPKDAQRGFLTFHDSMISLIVERMNVGHLDPVEFPSGQIARLTNLGYYLNGEEDPVKESLSAIEEFQCDFNLAVDGDCGPLTKKRLKEIYGC